MYPIYRPAGATEFLTDFSGGFEDSNWVLYARPRVVGVHIEDQILIVRKGVLVQS